jgi:hypothetical protein
MEIPRRSQLYIRLPQIVAGIDSTLPPVLRQDQIWGTYSTPIFNGDGGEGFPTSSPVLRLEIRIPLMNSLRQAPTRVGPLGLRLRGFNENR